MPQHGGDDLGATDEMIAFKDEGEQEEKVHQECAFTEQDLADLKSSLVNESEIHQHGTGGPAGCGASSVGCSFSSFLKKKSIFPHFRAVSTPRFMNRFARDKLKDTFKQSTSFFPHSCNLQAVRRGQPTEQQRGFPDKHREQLDAGKEAPPKTRRTLNFRAFGVWLERSMFLKTNFFIELVQVFWSRGHVLFSGGFKELSFQVATVKKCRPSFFLVFF